MQQANSRKILFHLVGFCGMVLLTMARMIITSFIRIRHLERTTYLPFLSGIDLVSIAICLVVIMVKKDRIQFPHLWWFDPWLGYLWAVTTRLITTAWLDDFTGMWVRTGVGIFGVYLLGGIAFWLRQRRCKLPEWQLTDLGGGVFAIGGRLSLI
jgi:hypothetical protein